jgi:NDP-sugar pyrophosphorylase family protein
VITRRESNIESDCQPFLDNFDVPVEFFVIDNLTEGPAATVGTLKEFIDLESPLIVVNSDQYITCDSDTFLDVFRKNEHFGFVLTMTANDSKWSFIERDSNGEMTRIVEKQIVSEEATVGLYGWSHAKHFFYSLDKMVEQGDRHNGEYYVAPTFNFLLKVGVPIFTFGIGAVENAVFGLGTPADLEIFLRHKSVREFRSHVTKSLRIS